MTIEEYELAEEYGTRFPRLSIYDRIALAIAKVRCITLMTGDGALRKAAVEEAVRVIGTIGVLDQLLKNEYIDDTEYCDCLRELLKYNGREIRLPKAEIQMRLQKTPQ